MKRWKIILPSLIATTSLPLVSLVGCGGNDPYPYIDFSYDDEDLSATINHFNDDEITNVVIPANTKHKNKKYEIIATGTNAFGSKENIQSVTFEKDSSFESLGTYTFYSCYNLAYVELPKNLKYIGENPFQHTKLTSITIPSSVEKIDDWAFSGEDFKKIIYQGSMEDFFKIDLGRMASQPSNWIPLICTDGAFNTPSDQHYGENRYYTININNGGIITDVLEQTVSEVDSIVIHYDPLDKTETITVTQGGTTLSAGVDYVVDKAAHTITIAKDKWNTKKYEEKPITFDISLAN